MQIPPKQQGGPDTCCQGHPNPKLPNRDSNRVDRRTGLVRTSRVQEVTSSFCLTTLCSPRHNSHRPSPSQSRSSGSRSRRHGRTGSASAASAERAPGVHRPSWACATRSRRSATCEEAALPLRQFLRGPVPGLWSRSQALAPTCDPSFPPSWHPWQRLRIGPRLASSVSPASMLWPRYAILRVCFALRHTKAVRGKLYSQMSGGMKNVRGKIKRWT